MLKVEIELVRAYRFWMSWASNSAHAAVAAWDARPSHEVARGLTLMIPVYP